MRAFIDWFQITDFFTLMMLAFILTFIGKQMAEDQPLIASRSTWFAGIAFLAYASMTISVLGIGNSTEALAIALRALLACGVAYGIGSILFSIHFAIHTQFEALIAKLAAPPPDEPVELIVEPPPRSPLSSLPLPPTPEERADRAWAQYQKRLTLIARANLSTIEETAAKEKAKHAYLKEIDRALS